jgi:hypothetical protein
VPLALPDDTCRKDAFAVAVQAPLVVSGTEELPPALPARRKLVPSPDEVTWKLRLTGGAAA